MGNHNNETEVSANGKRKGYCYLSTFTGLILSFLVVCLGVAVGLIVYFAGSERACYCVFPTGNSNGSSGVSVQNCKHLIFGGSSEISYRKVICEEERATLRCIGRQTIRVVRALYGRTDQVTCWSPGLTESVCSADYSLYKVYDMCNGKPQCSLYASKAIFSDPCVNTTKYLEVEYFCEETGSVCEGQNTTLSCPDNGKLSIISAMFGRTNDVTCGTSKSKGANCKARLSHEIVLHECQFRRSCKLRASPTVFGDPCPDTSKYLAVTYMCM